MSDTTTKTFSRRKLLVGLGLAATAAGAMAAPALQLSWNRKPGKAAGNWWSRRSFSLQRAGFQEWSQQVGSDFTVTGEHGNQTLKLASVEAFPAHGRRPAELGRDRAFKAVFESSDGKLPAGDRTYPMSHPTYGRLDVFVAPGGDKLVAVFN